VGQATNGGMYLKSLNQYENFLLDLFSETSNYLVGEELNELLQKQFGISSDYSRKVILRAVTNNIIHSSSPLTFGKRQFVYFGKIVYLSKETIKKIAIKYRPPVYRLLFLIDLNEGILSYYEALKITSCPLDESSTKVSSLKEIITDLKAINIIDIITDQLGVKYLIDQNKQSAKDSLIEMHYTKMYIDAIFLSDILTWLRKHNIIDNENVRFRNKSNPSIGVKHNNLVWDAFAYTRTTGINVTVNNNANWSENKQTLVVLDAIINREYTDEDLQGFYSRVQIVINSVKTGIRKIMPIIISKEISKFVSNKISKLGFIHLSLGTVFGERIFDLINKLNLIKAEQLHRLENSEQFVENIENVLSTIRNTGQETNLENIKGDLFEALLLSLLRYIYPDSMIDQGKILKSLEDEEKYEYDFIIVSRNNNEIVVVEAKGYKSTAVIKLGDRDTKYTVRWFFRRTFPFFKKYFDPGFYNYPLKGCYITTATFESEAIATLNILNESKIKPNQLNLYYDGNALLELVDRNNMTKISSLLKKYYM